jgi:hypothetical protein
MGITWVPVCSLELYWMAYSAVSIGAEVCSVNGNHAAVSNLQQARIELVPALPPHGAVRNVAVSWL